MEQALKVTNYTSYRSFLADLYQLRKNANKPYSYKLFATELGFAATNVIRLVIKGQRALSPKSAQTIAENLNLRHVERRYFLTLVAYNNARTHASKERFFQQLAQYKMQAAEPRSKDQMDYFSHWYHPIILEALRLEKGVYNADRIAHRLYPHINKEQVNSSIALLERLEMIRKDLGGRYIFKNDQVVFLPEKQNGGEAVLMGYHKQMLNLSSACLDLVPDDRRDYNAVTMLVSQAAFDKIKNRIQNLCKEVLLEEAESTSQEVIAQLNIQLFALTK